MPESVVIMIEVGYCNDTSVEKKCIDKTGQHAALKAHLEEVGFKSVTQHNMLAGVAGTIFKETSDNL